MKNCLALVIACGIALAVAGAPRGVVTAGSAVIYVDTSATGANDGTSWDNAYRSLRVAFANADGLHDIWVAAGVYRPNAAISDRNASFVLPSGIKVLGSFQGGEISPSQRDFGLSPTSILSGEIGTVVDSDNSYHVVTLPAGTEGRLEGFVISGRTSPRPATVSPSKPPINSWCLRSRSWTTNSTKRPRRSRSHSRTSRTP